MSGNTAFISEWSNMLSTY